MSSSTNYLYHKDEYVDDGSEDIMPPQRQWVPKETTEEVNIVDINSEEVPDFLKGENVELLQNDEEDYNPEDDYDDDDYTDDEVGDEIDEDGDFDDYSIDDDEEYEDEEEDDSDYEEDESFDDDYEEDDV
jgi:hypothetical protein